MFAPCDTACTIATFYIALCYFIIWVYNNLYNHLPWLKMWGLFPGFTCYTQCCNKLLTHVQESFLSSIGVRLWSVISRTIASFPFDFMTMGFLSIPQGNSPWVPGCCQPILSLVLERDRWLRTYFYMWKEGGKCEDEKEAGNFDTKSGTQYGLRGFKCRICHSPHLPWYSSQSTRSHVLWLLQTLISTSVQWASNIDCTGVFFPQTCASGAQLLKRQAQIREESKEVLN